MLERGQSLSLMELYIETLTGAAFEMKVHPADTVQDVKARIQKMEGIPITQQHLIWESKELKDDCCLCDYNIQDHSTLKLVLALRGGPINTRRISLRDDSSYGDLEYDSEFDDLDLTGLPFTVIVYHDGGRMKLFRILEREAISRSTDAADEDGETGVDSSALKHKMNILRLKMEKVHLDRKMKNLVLPHPPSHGRPGNQWRQPLFRRSTSLFAVPTTVTSNSSSVTPLSDQTLNVDQSGCVATTEHIAVIPPGAVEPSTETAVNATVTLAPNVVTAGYAEIVEQDEGASISLSHSQSVSVGVSTVLPPSDDSSSVELPASIPPQSGDSIANKQTEESHSKLVSKKPLSTTFPVPCRPPLSSAHGMRTLQRVPEMEEASSLQSGGRPQTSDSTPSAVVSLTRRRRSPACSSGRRSETTVVMETLDPLEVRSVLRSIVRSTGATGLALPGSARHARMDSSISDDLDLSSVHFHDPSKHAVLGGMDGGPGGSVSASPELPPVTKKPVKSVTKCFTCAKRTGLATSYLCRCGNNFCATHRYAEVHACSYDYKGEGRKLLLQENPMIACPKLPKI